MKNGYVYILTNAFHWVLYIWVTSDLLKRIMEHKEKISENSFSSKYNCNKLVYYEILDSIESAILREKQLKNWKREWKIALIEKENPEWKDLFDEIKNF